MFQAMLVILAALALDHLLGEPRKWHPLVGFGALAGRVENLFRKIFKNQYIAGILSVLVLLLPPTLLLSYIIFQLAPFAWPLEVIILYLTIGGRSLKQHAMRVHDALANGDIAKARLFTSHLVSRDTADMNEEQIARATIESTLENGADAVFAPLFWFAVGGAPAALFYRLANTLDAMWGYKNQHYVFFGWVAARLDDVLNFLPARLTAITYAVVGNFKMAVSCWWKQAGSYKSFNAGAVMASGAGALRLQLGGPSSYHGQMQDSPVLGAGSRPVVGDIKRSIKLLDRSILLMFIIVPIIVAVAVFIWLFFVLGLRSA